MLNEHCTSVKALTCSAAEFIKEAEIKLEGDCELRETILTCGRDIGRRRVGGGVGADLLIGCVCGWGENTKISLEYSPKITCPLVFPCQVFMTTYSHASLFLNDRSTLRGRCSQSHLRLTSSA